MKIAIATRAYTKVTGHAGRIRKWLVYRIEDGAVQGRPEQVELAPKMVFHHFEGSAPHPLDGIDVLITHSAGEGFQRKMMLRGVDCVLTAETDPLRAVENYLAGTLSPAKPRPLGELMCKAIDKLSGGH